MAIDFPKDFGLGEVKIAVVGVGGGGGNALNCMVRSQRERKSVSSDYEDMPQSGIEYFAFNTDTRALRMSLADHTLTLGEKLTQGRGAGNKPSVGENAATEAADKITSMLEPFDMIFITAGMGGGTGTGAAPVVAELIKKAKKDVLVVAVVTKPFLFECGPKGEEGPKMIQALNGIDKLKPFVDSLIVIPNQKLLGMNKSGKSLTLRESFNLADEVLKNAVESISDLINKDGDINVDYSDIKTILENSGLAHFAFGVGRGENKVTEALNQITSSPLLETDLKNAKRLLINFVAPPSVTMEDVDKISASISTQAHQDVLLIPGVRYTEDDIDELHVTVIAAGYDESDLEIAETNNITKIDNDILNKVAQPEIPAPPSYTPADVTPKRSSEAAAIFRNVFGEERL